MQSLIGKSVLNVHRTSSGVAPRVGVIVGFAPGINGGTRVEWPADQGTTAPYQIEMVTSDLALVEDWPRKGADGLSFVRLTAYAIEPTLPDYH